MKLVPRMYFLGGLYLKLNKHFYRLKWAFVKVDTIQEFSMLMEKNNQTLLNFYKIEEE